MTLWPRGAGRVRHLHGGGGREFRTRRRRDHRRWRSTSRRPGSSNETPPVGVGLLAGIGFTVSLFITELAYADPDLAASATLGVLAGSVIAAVTGTLLLARVGRRARGGSRAEMGQPVSTSRS